jgi:hypothetical protein
MRKRPTKQDERIEQLLFTMWDMVDSKQSSLPQYLVAHEAILSSAFWLELMWKGAKYHAQRRRNKIS